MKKESAALSIFHIKPSSVKHFSTLDLFNNNLLEGFISLNKGKTYGSLLITHINGEEVRPQLIRGMPKLKYPFNYTGNSEEPRIYNWPKNIWRVVVEEKYDGTNIVQYQYEFRGKSYTTYKTRLTPTLSNNTVYGSFKDWVDTCIKRDPTINIPIEGYNRVFELCGYLNPHMVKYDFDIKMVEIANIETFLGTLIPVKEINNQRSALVNTYEVTPESLQLAYETSQKQDDLQIVSSGMSEGDFPLEGKVFYLIDNLGEIHVYKCKPETIEKIHFARGGIPTEEINIAVTKAIELNEFSVKGITQILLEDWSAEAVEVSSVKVSTIFEKFVAEFLFREQVLAEVIIAEENLLLSAEDRPHPKAVIMREIAKYNVLHRSMPHIYTAAKVLGLVT